MLFGLISATLIAGIAHAQVGVSANLGTQPLWGPTGYDYVHYYYLPDIDAYYDVPKQEYVYPVNGHWVSSADLPPRYAHYDLYRGYKAVINDPEPWLHHDRYRGKYMRYRNHHNQQVIRDSREEKYWANPAHPRHSDWHSTARQQHFKDGPHGNR